MANQHYMLSAVLIVLVQQVTGTVIDFFTDRQFDERYVERDEQVNTLYHTWQGYGLDCYHHINQQFELRIYFRGRPIAGATVLTCSRNSLADTIKIRPFGAGVHHLMVCTEESCNMYNFQDPHKDKEGSQDRLTKPVDKQPMKEDSCYHEWCSFTESDVTLKNEVFYYDLKNN